MKYILYFFTALILLAPGALVLGMPVVTSTIDTDQSISNVELEQEKLHLRLKIHELLNMVLEIQSYNDEVKKRGESKALICPALPRSIYLGDSGYDVMLLQHFLKDLGTQIYPELEIGGTYNIQTKNAVGRFQALTSIVSSGQPGYGVTGPRTREAIKNYCSKNNYPLKYTFGQNTINGVNSDQQSIKADEPKDKDIFTNTNQTPLVLTQSSTNYTQYLRPSSVYGFLNTYTPAFSYSGSKIGYSSEGNLSISFVTNSIPASLTIGGTYEIRWTGSSPYAEIVSIEGIRDTVRHFFGSYLMQDGSAVITIPNDFIGKDSITLIISHKSQQKDSVQIPLN